MIGYGPLVDVQKIKENERGYFYFRSDGNTEIVRWNDNSVVTIGSNAYGVQPIGSVKRWTKEKGKQNIQQPAVIAAYNRGMSGVDLLYRALFDSRPVICGKKWYWPLVINAINIAFLYSWRLYRIISGETIPQKDFRWHIVAVMITQSKPHAISVDSCATKAHKVSDEVRYYGSGHYPISFSVRKMCCLWETLQTFMWEVQTKLTCQNMLPDFPWKVTMQWHYYHNTYYVHYLTFFCKCCHKKCILSITNVFLTCEPQTIEGNLS